MGKSSPRPPDPQQVASEQGELNRNAQLQNTLYNQIDQTSPWGNMTYSGDLPTFDEEGGVTNPGDRALNVELSPGQQQSYDQTSRINNQIRGFAENTLLPQVQQSLKDPMDFQPADYSGLPQLGGQQRPASTTPYSGGQWGSSKVNLVVSKDQV